MQVFAMELHGFDALRQVDGTFHPYGFAPSIHTMGNEEISLSKMTLSHQMIRLLFVEQIYRAMTILNGEPYHHE